MILVTGCSGFIGMHSCIKLLKKDYKVIGIDNLNDYYSISLKEDRLKVLKKFPNFIFSHCDIADEKNLKNIFNTYKIDYVLHLAAQAGVRYSISNPQAYVKSNVQGFVNLLEEIKDSQVKNTVYASSSSVYGSNTKVPFSEDDFVSNQVSLYAATKLSNESIANAYNSIYKIPIIGLRFFTVYGPWGRPDMAPWIFTEKIIKGEKIKVFNNGNMIRDFTYVDDIVSGTIDALLCLNYDSHEIFNIGNNSPIKLMDFIIHIEKILEKKASIDFMPMQKGDVLTTYADIDKLSKAVNYIPKTSIHDGMKSFIEWYKHYFDTIND